MIEEYIKLLVEKTQSDTISYMIAFYPSEDSIKKIVKLIEKISDQIPDDARILPSEELHSTIRYWKENTDKLNLVKDNIKQYKMSKPIRTKIISLNILGDSLSLMLQSNVMQLSFSKIDNMLKKLGLPPSDYPTYKPHLALYYCEHPKQIDIKPDFDIVYDKIKLVDGNDKEIYSLNTK